MILIRSIEESTWMRQLLPDSSIASVMQCLQISVRSVADMHPAAACGGKLTPPKMACLAEGVKRGLDQQLGNNEVGSVGKAHHNFSTGH